MGNPHDAIDALPKDYDVDFAAPEFLADPWPPLLLLQRNDPLFWSRKQNGWIVTRHSDAKAAFTMDEQFSPDRIVSYFEQYGDELRQKLPNIFRYTPKWLANMDAPAHTRVRQLFVAALHRKIIERERLYARELVDELLEAAGKRREFDFVTEIAQVIPSRIICHMLGIDESRRAGFLHWGEAALQGALAAEPTPEILAQTDEALARLAEVIAEEIAEVHREPRNDLLTSLVQARYENDRLSDDELVATCQLILAAGFDTTKHTLSHGLVELVQRPQAVAYMLAGSDNVAGVVNELLRYLSVAKALMRVVRHDFDWHGKTLHKGDVVFISNGAANRDPAFWDSPEEFDPQRDNSGTLAFGTGAHHCVGHLLAKMELGEFFSAAFARFDIEILAGDRNITPSYGMRTINTLPVRFTPKSGSLQAN